MHDSIIFNTDSYKASHFLQYPPEATHISSYIEARGGAYQNALFFGLQIYLNDYLTRPITKADIAEAKWEFAEHGEPFNEAGWLDMANRFGGLPPVRIQAIKEGSIVPTGTPLVQIMNTDPAFAWLPSYLETALLRAVWYPTTVATRSATIKSIIKGWLTKTSDDPESALPFMLHDFGARGGSSHETAAIGGCAHLINFMGTDTYAGARLARRIYGERMAGFSVPAGEHSTITSWGRYNEEVAFAHMIDTFAKPGKIVAMPIDSYDVYRAARESIGTNLKAKIEKSGARIVCRPDSGDPTIVPVECIEILASKFGCEENGKGYRVLPHCIRVLQGDGVNERSIDAILCNLAARGFSAENIVFGMGGEILQTVNRDTMKFAMKASAIRFGTPEWKPVYKDPITDPGKASKKGRLAVVVRDGKVATIQEGELGASEENLLDEVYVDGAIVREQSFADIRARAAAFI
jgi:nicotinamide phosphoribosyltransferase